MRIRDNFDETVIVQAREREWVPSPAAGVERVMLDRIGGEVARATSLVRFAPGSRFDAHTHGGGEEYIVLEGVFSDDSGDYPAGTYVRNPIGTSHTPHTDPGCVIFVKLHQFAASDDAQFDVSLDTALDRSGGAAVLHETEEERVEVIDLAPGAEVTPPRGDAGGTEILVLSGQMTAEGADLTAGSWARFPAGRDITLRGTGDGARVWVKSGHLAHIREPA